MDLSKATGNRVELKVVESFHLYKIEAQQADVLFAPLSWIASFPEILRSIPDQNEFHKLLSTDFVSLKLDLNLFLPVLWKTEAKENKLHLLIWGFATSQDEKDEVQGLLNFLLTNNARLIDWAKNTPLAFTLQETNTLTGFPEAQRAQMIRKVSLPNLIIDQQN
jgi:hypothetical protein